MSKDTFDYENGKWSHGVVGKITFNNNDYIKSSQAGWLCPKCGRIWAPWIAECTICNLQKKVNNEKDIKE